MIIVESNGYKFFCRPFPGWDDEFCVDEVVARDVYKMKDWKFKNGTIIDIGGNIGTFAIPASKYGHVIAYEPSPTNFKILEMNIALNNADVEAHNCAVGKRGIDTVEIDNSGHTRMGSVGGLNGEPVESIAFDDIPAKHIDVLKMDCEGGEYAIINNATALDRVDLIVGELHSWLFEDDEYKDEHIAMIKKLKKYFKLEFEGYKDSALFGVKK